jgi:2-oxoacid:acceptor oxidoreductase gamma subunit (pyruvate/2-ketoisovalerate family)
MLEEIRWHGRGGQGAVTSAKIIAEAAYLEGKSVQAFAFYGAERRGAPVETYTRISDKKVRRHSQIVNPTVVAVLDPMLSQKLYLKGITKGTTIVVNASKAKKLDTEANCDKYWIDATEIAIDLKLRVAESYITNTIMAGAVAKATGLVKLDSVIEGMKKLLPERIWEKNAEAITRGFKEIKPYGGT